MNDTHYTYPPEEYLEIHTGFDIGYDYARFNINLPDNPPKSFEDGYNAYKAKNKYYIKSTSFERRVIRLRYSAWRRNRTFDPNITADYLESITTDYCPITRKPFTWGMQCDTDASVERASNNAGYAVGNILYISNIANLAKGGKSFADMLEIYKEGNGHAGLTHEEWARLTYLSYACDSSERGRVQERFAIFPMYLFLPNYLDICNILALLQKAVAVAALPLKIFPIANVKQQAMLIKVMTGIGEKRSTRLFKRFSSLYSTVMRKLCSEHNQRSKFENTTSSIISDIWLQPGVTEAYIKWLESFSAEHLHELLLGIESKAELCEYSNWHMETGGYVKPKQTS